MKEEWQGTPDELERDFDYQFFKDNVDLLAKESDRMSYEKGEPFKDSQGVFRCKEQNVVEMAINLYIDKYAASAGRS